MCMKTHKKSLSNDSESCTTGRFTNTEWCWRSKCQGHPSKWTCLHLKVNEQQNNKHSRIASTKWMTNIKCLSINCVSLCKYTVRGQTIVILLFTCILWETQCCHVYVSSGNQASVSTRRERKPLCSFTYILIVFSGSANAMIGNLWVNLSNVFQQPILC